MVLNYCSTTYRENMLVVVGLYFVRLIVVMLKQWVSIIFCHAPQNCFYPPPELKSPSKMPIPTKCCFRCFLAHKLYLLQ